MEPFEKLEISLQEKRRIIQNIYKELLKNNSLERIVME